MRTALGWGGRGAGGAAVAAVPSPQYLTHEPDLTHTGYLTAAPNKRSWRRLTSRSGGATCRMRRTKLRLRTRSTARCRANQGAGRRRVALAPRSRRTRDLTPWLVWRCVQLAKEEGEEGSGEEREGVAQLVRARACCCRGDVHISSHACLHGAGWSFINTPTRNGGSEWSIC